MQQREMGQRIRRTARMLFATALATGAALIGASAVLAAPGDLDTTFSGDGVASTYFGAQGGVVNDIAIDAQGRIIAAGYGIKHQHDVDVTLARYLPDGSPDPSFSGDGKLRAHFPFTNMAQGVAVDSQGRIVVAGTVGTAYCCSGGGGFFFARFLPNGRFDRSFSGDGRRKVAFGNMSGATDVALDHKGRIVAAGYDNGASDGLHYALVRLQSNGTLDRSFGADGKARFSIGSSSSEANSVAIDSLGRIVVGGDAVQDGDMDHFAVARLLPNGSLDPGFSRDGRQFSGLRGWVESVVIDDQDRVVAAGDAYIYDQDKYAFGVVRYRTDGSLDASFSGDGSTVTPFADYAGANSVALDPEGRVVAAGLTFSNFGNLALARYGPSGSLDTSFGNDGRIELDLEGTDLFNAVAIDPNGRIVAAGARDNEFAVVRYLGGP